MLAHRISTVSGVLDSIEVRFLHVAGDWRWFEILVENLLDQPEVGGVIIHTRDVSDRRRAQEELATIEVEGQSGAGMVKDQFTISAMAAPSA